MLNFHSIAVIADDKGYFSYCIASSAVKLGNYDERNLLNL